MSLTKRFINLSLSWAYISSIVSRLPNFKAAETLKWDDPHRINLWINPSNCYNYCSCFRNYILLAKTKLFSIHELGKNIDETNQYGIQRRLGHLLSIRFALLLFWSVGRWTGDRPNGRPPLENVLESDQFNFEIKASMVPCNLHWSKKGLLI